MPVRVEQQQMPDPSLDYSMQDMVDYMPNALTYSGQAQFTFAFYASRPLNQFVPSVLNVRGWWPLWLQELPFNPVTLSGLRSNIALVALRKRVSAFIEWYRNPLLRVTTGNYQSPTRLPGSITL